jgi:hypothetical protein
MKHTWHAWYRLDDRSAISTYPRGFKHKGYAKALQDLWMRLYNFVTETGITEVVE